MGNGTTLKQIEPAEARLGMYVHAFQGGWLSHSFWKGGFLLTEPAHLETIRSSAIKSITIDLARGIEMPSPLQGPPHRAMASLDAIRQEERRIEDRRLANAVADEAGRVMKDAFEAVRIGKFVDADQMVEVVRSITLSLDRNRFMLLGVMRLRAKDSYTYYHSVSVCSLMVNFARELGLAEEEVHLAGLAGLLHDIGKAAVPESILNKPGRLTVEEWQEIKQHTVRGYDLLRLAGDVPPLALDVCLHHHEKMDGSGYPFGLGAAEISLAARMGSICDVYDALTSARAYKEASSPVAAIAAMKSWPGHLDPGLLFTFMKSVGIFPVGMIIRLRSNALAIVRGNGRRASRARLTIFYDTARNALVSPRDMFLADLDDSDLLLGEADPDQFGIADWPALREMLLAGRNPLVSGGA